MSNPSKRRIAALRWILTVCFVTCIPLATDAQRLAVGPKLPVAVPTPGPSRLLGMLGAPAILDAADQVVGTALTTSRLLTQLFVANGEVDGRPMPFTLYVRRGGFQVGARLYHLSPDCTGRSFIQDPGDQGILGRTLDSAPVMSPNVDEFVASGPGTTAYIPFGDLLPLHFGSYSFSFDPSVGSCADGFVSSPSACCVPLGQDHFGVPTVPVDLSKFVPPFRLDLLEAAADRPRTGG